MISVIKLQTVQYLIFSVLEIEVYYERTTLLKRKQKQNKANTVPYDVRGMSNCMNTTLSAMHY